MGQTFGDIFCVVPAGVLFVPKIVYICKNKPMLEHVIPANCRISVSPKHYETISAYIESAEAFGRNMFRPIFIVDMYKKDFLYVSNNFSYLFGEDDPEHPVSRGEKYIPSFAREDIGTLKTIFQSAYDLFLSFPVAERKELIFSFSFHHHRNGKKKVVHQSVTPLALTDDGDLWLVLCTTSYSSKKEPGDYVMKVHNDREYMQYSLEKDRWYHKEGLLLSTEEKEILLLSSQGYTMKEIAPIFGKSVDAIKLYKRVLFSKLGVRSITEAVMAAINRNLI